LYITVDTDVIDAFGGSPTWFQFDVKGASSFEQTITSSRDAGTSFYEQVLN